MDPIPEVHKYLEEAQRPYSPEQVERVAYVGTKLVQVSGGYVKAGMQIQELRMRSLHVSRTTIEQYSYLYPAIADQVMEIFTNGVNPWMRGQKPPTCEEDTLPHQRSMTNIILKTLWGDVNEGLLFICHKSSVPEQEMIFPTCTGTATKRNPDRTISEKLRIIADLRRVNLALRKEELFPVMTPTIQQIATRIIQLKRRFPDTEILLNKRDIAKAFKLIPANPHLVKCLRHVFKAETSATTSGILGCPLSLPIGWVASPSFFGLVAEVIQEIHYACGPEDDSWNLNAAYRTFLYVDDCMLVEPSIGTRPQDSVEAWDRICELILTEKSLSKEKADIEGRWSVEHTILGFVVNTKEGTIAVPEEKVLGARAMISPDVFTPGNSRIALRDVQILRGLCQHWLVSNWFWKVTLQTIDVLLAHADENSSYATCIDADVWAAFWTLLEVMRVAAAEENRWKLLFSGALDRLLPIEKRFSGPRVETSSLWLTSDATLQKGGAVNWKNKQYLDVTIEEAAKPFIGDREYTPIIAEAELAVECLGFATWTPVGQERFVTFLGGDNANAFSWIHNGKAKVGLGRDILAGFQLYVAIYALEPAPFYMRTHHNITADFITRVPHSAITHWIEDESFTRATIPWRWGEIARISQLFDWAGWLPKTEVCCLLKHDRPLVLVEWGGASFTATSVWQRMGQSARCYESRIPVLEKFLGIWRVPVWKDEPVDVLVGTAWDAFEVGSSQSAIMQLNPRWAVLITPSHLYECEGLPMRWTSHFWVDGSLTGGVIGGCWNVFFWTQETRDIAMNLPATRRIMTIEDAYPRVDKQCALQEDLPLKRYKIEESIGYVVFPIFRRSETAAPPFPVSPGFQGGSS